MHNDPIPTGWDLFVLLRVTACANTVPVEGHVVLVHKHAGLECALEVGVLGALLRTCLHRVLGRCLCGVVTCLYGFCRLYGKEVHREEECDNGEQKPFVRKNCGSGISNISHRHAL